ncbi:MAG: hypothetical protein GX579_11995, partial [Chloroflexi bacterium]|nr:hypothetical protein [Chloroflexota bacterium]
MLSYRPKSHRPKIERLRRRRAAAFRPGRRHALRLLPLALLVVLIASCAPGDAPPPGVCDTYSRSLFTTQLLGGAAVLLGLAVL